MSTGLRAGTNNDGYLQVNGTDVLTALSSGNVGIGTTSPVAPLEVIGIIRSSDPTGHYTQVGADGQIELVRVSGNGPYIDFKNLANEDYDCRIQQSSDGLQFWTGGSGAASVKLIVTSAGDVSIGNNSSTAKLTVTNNSGTGPINLGDFTAAAANQNPLLRLIGRNAADSGTTSVDFYKEYQGGFRLVNNDTDSTNFTAFEIGGAERLRITSDGKIGIKVVSPGCQTGGIHAVHDATEGTPSFTGGEVGIFQRNYNSAQGCEIGIIGGSNSSSRINFGDKDDADIGIISYSHNDNSMRFTAAAAEKLRIASDGSTYRGGVIITESDMGWAHDTYQRPHIFTGATGGLPGDASVVLATPTQDPSNTRIGSIVFGCAVSGGSTSNPGIKATIEGKTNTNVASASDTGGYLAFVVKPDNGNLYEAARITSSGELNLGTTDSFAATLAIKSDANTTRQVKLLSTNTDWGWGFDTIDLLSGNVPLRLFQRWSHSGTVYERQAIKISQANNGATGVTRVAINDTSTSVPAQTFTIREDVSAGYGATLALQNKGGSVNGTATAILFGVDTSATNAPGQTDTANATITVTNSGVSNDADMRFWIHTGSGGNKDALKIVGDGNNRASAGTAVGEACRGGVAFGTAGMAIDRAWGNYPGFHVFHTTTDGFTQQGEVRFHGWNTSYDSYPETNGADFSVSLRIDGSSYHVGSDRRHKTNIVDNPYGLEEILQLQPRKFNRINSQGDIETDKGDILGFIAQEVIEVIPEAVTYYPDEDTPNEIGWCRSYSLSNEFILSSLVNAVKELSAKNDALEARIAALEG